jgi:hypothetical protein
MNRTHAYPLSYRALGQWLVVAFVALMLVGCSAPPDQEESDAIAAVNAARDAEAERFAPAERGRATESLDRANEEKAKQDKRFRLFRSYGTAKEMYIETRNLAVAARDAAVRGRGERGAQSQRMLDLAVRSVEACSDTLAGAPTGKGTKVDIAMFREDIAELSGRIPAIQPLIDRGDFGTADSLSAVISRDATDLQTRILNASRKPKP